VLVNYSFYHAIPYLRFKVENGNIYSKTSENGTALTTEESQSLREEISNTAQYYTERLIEYIRNNIGDFLNTQQIQVLMSIQTKMPITMV
jgi:hypothetical protein